MRKLTSSVRNVVDFPTPGVLFKDVTPLLSNGPLFRDAIAAMSFPYRDAAVTHVAGVESRGFIFGAAIAVSLGCGFIPIRKAGKLPGAVASREYALEYGRCKLEMHLDAYDKGSRVVLIDDVLATGGTAQAAALLIEEVGGVLVGCSFLMAIASLRGATQLGERTMHALLWV